ncbi:glycosyltransferase family 9 protein [Flavobacterium sp.]|uniref:glycosyltransferase family 9 protein n=1 Tax=Flavobacterium sp. TaxID=239 RepID=UPI003B9AFA94
MKKILVIQQKMIGDVLASSILCNNLRQIYPKAQIHYLIYPFTKPVVENNPNIDSFVLYEDSYKKSSLKRLQFLYRIRKERYNMVIDAYNKPESFLVTMASGADVKIGFFKKYSQKLYHFNIAPIDKPLTNAGTALENRINLLSCVAPNFKFDLRPKIWLTTSEKEEAQNTLQKHGILESDPFLVIGILGSDESKSYPAPYMAQVLDFIAANTSSKLVLNYMPKQANEVQTICALCAPETRSRIISELVPSNIRAFLALTHFSQALIGNEGGAVNMAKALGIKTFTIFSTWIIKEAWNSFEDGSNHVSVHLQDYKPELYGDKTAKQMKKNALPLYQAFTPDLMLPALEAFLNRLKS